MRSLTRLPPVLFLLIGPGCAGPLPAASTEEPPTIEMIARHKTGIWSIDPVGRLHRWIVIHDPGVDQPALYHIEVLGRKIHAPVWQVTRLAPHMAITPDALLRSIRKPLFRGSVYPEQYEEALHRWNTARQQENAFICTTSVARCLEN